MSIHINSMHKGNVDLPMHCDLFLCDIYRETVGANASFDKSFQIAPLLSSNKEKRGIAVDGRLKDEDTNLASTTL